MRLNHPRTLAWVSPDSEHILAAPRTSLTRLIPLLQQVGKFKWVIRLQERAKFDCCRKIDNLELEAWYSKQSEKDAQRPDVYKFYCRECETEHQLNPDRGYCHAVFCVGGTHTAVLEGKVTREQRPDLVDIRPIWGNL